MGGSPPLIIGQEQLSVPEDNSITISLNHLIVIDEDSDYPEDFSLDVRKGSDYRVKGDTVTPDSNFFGDLVVSVRVNDGDSNSDTYPLNVFVTPVNDLPVVSLRGSAEITLEVGEPFIDGGATATDVEDGSLEVVVGGDTVDSSVPGTYMVVYTATDSDGGSVSVERTVVVIGANEAPLLTGPIIPDPISVAENSPFSFSVSEFFSDPDGDPLSFAVTGLPASGNLTMNPLTGVIAGTPDHADAEGSPYTLVITASDSQLTVSDNGVTLIVVDVNTPPVAEGPVPNQTATENKTFTFNTARFFSDPDGDSLSYSAAGLPVSGGLTIDPNTGIISGEALDAAAQASPFIIELSAVDPGGLSAGGPAHSFSLAVIDINNPPRENPEPSDLPEIAPTAIESFPYELDLNQFFSDADGDDLVFQISGLPSSGNLTLDSSSGLLSGIPTDEDTVDIPITLFVTVSDIPRLPFSPTSIGPLSFTLPIPALDRVDLGLSIDSAPNPATVDEQVSWIFNITNYSPLISVSDIEIDATLAGIPFTFTNLGGCSAGDQSLTCMVGPLAPESSTTVTVTGQATQAGDVVLTANATISQITGYEPIDANPGNNFSIATKNIGESFSSGPGQTLVSSSGLALAAGDVDGDGFTDLVVATASGVSTKVYLSSPKMDSEPGTEMFRQLSSQPVALGDVETASTSISVVDLDGDGDLDLATANGTPGAPQGNSVFMNESGESGLVLTPIDGLLGNQTSHDVAAADLDGNGFMDLIYANGSPNEIFLNVGNGDFIPGQLLGDSDSRAVIVDDFDGDGILDLLFANIDGPSRAYRGLGGGSFTEGVAIEAGPVVSVQNNDVSGDNRPDLIFGRETATPPALPSNTIYVNTSTPAELSFSPIDTTLGTSPTVKLLSDDVSLDGTVDLVTLNRTGTHQIFVGSGNGAFTLHPEQFLSEDTTSGAFGDFNNDGRIDLAVGGFEGIDIFLNDGFGNLGAGDTTLPVINMLGPASVDLQIGDFYEDASSTAFDNADGDLTERVVTTNPVNTAVVGSYFVTYNVFDLSGNAALSVSRIVTVSPIENVGGGGGGATTTWLLAVLLVLSLIRWRTGKG